VTLHSATPLARRRHHRDRIEVAPHIAAHLLPAESNRVGDDRLVDLLQLVDDRRPLDERRRALDERTVVVADRGPVAQNKARGDAPGMLRKFLTRPRRISSTAPSVAPQRA
jgi:hypothetical protein